MKLHRLTDEFMTVYAENRLRPTTIRGYRVNLDHHILPMIGHLDIDRITPDTLDRLNSSMTELGNKSKLYVHATLRKVLNYAVKRRYIDFNPYQCYDLPRVKKYSYTTLTEDELRRLLQNVQDTSIEAPVKLAVCYGLRRGECLGIHREDVDRRRNVLHVQRTRTTEHREPVITDCKTEESNRYILLREEDARMLCGKAGRMLEELTPMALQYRFKKVLKESDLPEIRFHDLRHSYATLMMAKGINPKFVSMILGHSRVDTTLDIYSHPDVTMQQICIDILNTKKPEE